MNRKIIFVSIIIIISVLGYFLYKLQIEQSPPSAPAFSPSATKSSNEHSSTSSTSDVVANLKSYRSVRYGFEFQYPTEWNLTEDSTPNYGDLGISISNGELEIDIDISSDLGKALGGGSCEGGGFHVESCSNKTTLSGIRFARIVQAGMSTEITYRSRFLKVYMNTSKAFLQFSTTIVNEDGVAVPNADHATETFDKILSTFKFIP